MRRVARASKAVERGLSVNPVVKASLAPGSRVVSDYLDRTGLQPYLDQLGFHLVGYGCTTCIGNSGPLAAAVEDAINKYDLIAAAVLSGNRNFEARVHQSIKANFLMSPPLVVAFALAGRVDLDLTSEPLGTAKDGKPVFLRDLWPSLREIRELMRSAMQPEVFRKLYRDFAGQNSMWNEIPSSTGRVYQWDANSTYIQEPPFFENFSMQPGGISEIQGARALAIFGDSVTTDHISPAGSIKKTSPAGAYLIEHRVPPVDFNSYGSRRYRGFETILQGRPPMDALVIAPRVCGICSVAQSTATASALGSPWALESAANGRRAPNLLSGECRRSSDPFRPVLHARFRPRRYAGQVLALRLRCPLCRHEGASPPERRRRPGAAFIWLEKPGRRMAHSLALQPGGTPIRRSGRADAAARHTDRFRAYLEQQIFGDRLERVAQIDCLEAWAAEKPDGEFRFFLRLAEDLGLAQWGRGPKRFLSHGGPLFAAGSWTDGVRSPLDLSALREDLGAAWMAGEARHPTQGTTEPDADKPEAYSWCKAPRLGGDSVEVGAIARQVIAGHPLIERLVGASDNRANIRDRVVARLLELALLVPAMEGWVKSLGGDGPFCHTADMPPSAQGAGAGGGHSGYRGEFALNQRQPIVGQLSSGIEGNGHRLQCRRDHHNLGRHHVPLYLHP